MNKIINNPESFVDETVEGIVSAYGDRLRILNSDSRILVRNVTEKSNKVALVTGGGSGHLPLFLGYVGDGLLDGCAIGNVFASPPAVRIANMIRACDNGEGVLCLYGNYGGDKLNFDLAIKMVETEGIRVESIRVNDDLASAPINAKEKRRGIAGLVFAYKIAGAAASTMRSLTEVTSITRDAVDNIFSMGVALTPCIVPEVGKPTFFIEDGKMEIGMGIHGEPGIDISEKLSANEVANVLLKRILSEIHLHPGDEVSVMLNGLGATPLEELFIVFRRVKQILSENGVSIYMPHIGEFATSMEMAGLSLSVFKLNDLFKSLLRYPASSPFYTNNNK